MRWSIDKTKELLRWGPIDGRLVYPDFFTLAFAEFSKGKFHTWPDLLGLFYKGKMTYVADMKKIRSYGSINFKKFILPNLQRKLNYHNWVKLVGILIKIQNNVTAEKLSQLTNGQLYRLYDLWSKNYLKFWQLGYLPEFAGWGGEQLLKDNLQNLKGQKFILAFEKLSAPEALSFYQKAGLELYQLKKNQTNKKLFARKLTDFQRKHFWILNSYSHSKVLPVAHFKNQLKQTTAKQAAQKIKDLLSLPDRVKKEKQKIAAQLKISRQTLKIARALAFCVHWQDQRKYYIFLANHILDVFLKEAANRFRLKFDDLHNYNHYEIHKLFKTTRPLPPAELKRRKLAIVTHYIETTNSVEYLSGKKAKTIIDYYLKPVAIKDYKYLTGIVVSKGPKVVGKVRIILSPKEVGKMQKGDVLVTTMTSPDFIVAMKKAKAIITDSGGMTSHAAIVSRELGLPCIVNTLYSTQIFKDGDLVEVDTNKGMVRKNG